MVGNGHDIGHAESRIRLDCQGCEGGQVDKADCLAVRFGIDKLGPANLAVRPGQVVDDQCPANVLFRFRSENPGAGIRAGTRLVGNDYIDVARGRPGGHGRYRRKQKGCGQKDKKFFHASSSLLEVLKFSVKIIVYLLPFCK